MAPPEQISEESEAPEEESVGEETVESSDGSETEVEADVTGQSDTSDSEEADDGDEENDGGDEEADDGDEENDGGDEEADDGDEEEDPIESMGREESLQALYALLFVSDRPMNATRLAEAISEDMDPEIVSMLLEELQEELNGKEELPYFLKEIGGGFQLLTKSVYAPFIRRLYQIKKSKRLSKAVLETLAIIAYKQPTTRAEVEAIRGVSVSHAFEQLQERRLIKISGVADLPGRPKLFRTTDDFLAQFGLGSLKELPTLEELQEVR